MGGVGCDYKVFSVEQAYKLWNFWLVYLIIVCCCCCCFCACPAGAIAVKTGYLSSTSDTSVLVSGLNCAGTEDDLLACGFTQQPFECPRGRDSAGVVCVTGESHTSLVGHVTPSPYR